MKRAVLCAFTVAASLIWAVLFFLPPAKTLQGKAEEGYVCAWQSGERTRESYFAAYRDFVGVSASGKLLLEREGKIGAITPSDAYSKLSATLQKGSLGELLQANIGNVKQLERVALYRTYHSRLWYDGEFFEWTGEKVARASLRTAEEVVLLEKTIPPSILRETGAKKLYLRAEAEINVNTLRGSNVESVVAQLPYLAEGNAVCLQTPSGTRLVAGIPAATTVTVSQAVRYADEGALLACTNVRELELPFLGSALSSAGSGYKGELAYLFSTGTEYLVPATLERVRVTGGTIVSHAFYRCNRLLEINVCGVSSADIAYDAFIDCTNLLILHTPRANVRLAGSFQSSVAPCGCTVYERTN